MIKIENVEEYGWQQAIKSLKAKGYSKTKSGKYVCFDKHHGKSINLGTKDTEEEAKEVVYQNNINKFINNVYPLNPKDCKVFSKNYVVFPSGQIFNLHGHEMKGVVDKSGYREVTINGTEERVHRIVAFAFLPLINGKNFVNHINGNKLDNRIENLEWVTRSENTLHSFKNGLQKTISGSPVYTDEEKLFIKMHLDKDYKYIAEHLNRNKETVRKYRSKFKKEMLNDACR